MRPTSWPSSLLFLCSEAPGGTRLASPTPSIQGDWVLWLWAGVPHPQPQGCWHVSAPVPEKLLLMAGTVTAMPQPGAALPPWATWPRPPLMTFLSPTVSHPNLWKETVLTKSPYQEFTDHLVKTHPRVSVQRTQAPAMATT